MTALAPPPVPFVFNAPAHWRAIDFISDLHLSETMPRTFAAWSAHLLHTPADAVFMLGDLFALWVGDDMRSRTFEQQCVQVLAHAARSKHTAFMAGNRDFLLGADMLRDAGLHALPDPTLLHAWGRPVLLSHGDALCLDDRSYQAFRTQVRNPAWQVAFLAKPLTERLAIAAQVRQASQAKQPFDGDGSADVDAHEALRWLHAAGAQTLVHGHTHRPADHVLAPGVVRHVLTDWDLDAERAGAGDHGDQRPGHSQRAGVMRLTRDGFARVAPSAAPACS